MNFNGFIKGAAIAVLLTANVAAAAPVVGNEPEPNYITDSFDAAISGAEVVFPYYIQCIHKKVLLPIYVCSRVKI